MHLLLPLAASLLLVCGLLIIKRIDQRQVGTVTTLFFTNIFSAIAFSFLWFMGGTIPSYALLWQPAIIAWLFIQGIVFTYLAIQLGDVSIATPVLGVKVLLVAVLLTLISQTQLPRSVWIGACLAMAGIVLIQWTGSERSPNGERPKMWSTIAMALAAAGSFATFDVLVQTWAPAWGSGRFLPIVYIMVGVATLTTFRWVNWESLREPRTRRLVFSGSAFVALQAVCIVFALAQFGDAARVNVVYTLRGIWAVVLALIVAKIWGGAEASLSRKMIVLRVVGAVLLTVAVVVVILDQS